MNLQRAPSRVASLAGVALVATACFLGALCCGPDSSSAAVTTKNGPSLVLITISSLRFDATGLDAYSSSPLPPPAQGSGWTPNLDRLAAQAWDRGGWAGAALASSTETAPSAASLMTGLMPRQHGALRRNDALPDTAFSLAEYLQAAGYRTTAYVDKGPIDAKAGFGQGFESFRPLRRAKAAAGHLSSLDADRELVWIHLRDIDWPYLRHPETAGRLGVDVESLPQRLSLRRLEAFFDPARKIPAGFGQTIRQLYAGEVDHADRRLGRLLEALESAPAADQSWLVVAGLHGADLAEVDRIGNGSGLTRAGLTTALVILPPQQKSLDFGVGSEEVVELRRAFASMLEATGLSAPLATPPSLFTSSPASPITAELYSVGGFNEFSLVDGDLRLLRRTRFSNSVRDSYLLRRQAAGALARWPLERSPELLAAQLDQAFAWTPPFSGTGPRSLEQQLERWLPDGQIVPLESSEDAPEMQRMTRDLEALYGEFAEHETRPLRPRRPTSLAPGQDL